MKKINFENGVTKANAETMNTFQTNIENAINELSETILYENNDGVTNDLTLNDNVTNYRTIKIYYKKDNNLSSVELYTNGSNNRECTLSLVNVYEENAVQFVQKKVTIANKIISVSYSNFVNFKDGSLAKQSSENQIKITKVVGYKY